MTSVGGEQRLMMFYMAVSDAMQLYRSLLRVMLYSGGRANPEDDPFVINPARYDPADAMVHAFIPDRPKVLTLCAKSTGDVRPSRFICVDVVLVVACNILVPQGLYNDNSKLAKQLCGAPMYGEHDRAAAFFGTVFGEETLLFTSYGLNTTEEKYNGIAYRTMVANSGTAANSTPKKGMLLYLVCKGLSF